MEEMITEKIVIVVGDRKTPHAHHIKLDGTVRVGRALSSDVILSDEHVEPLQLVFFEQEEVRKVQVLPGMNPVWRNGEVITAGTYDFVSGDEWHVGRTFLQVFHESHVPEPTEKLAVKDYRGSQLERWLIFFATFSALLGWTLFASWIGDYEPIEWNKKLATTITDANFIFVFVWATFWSLIGRMVTGRNQFILHFCIASVFLLVDVLNGVITEYMSYGTNHEVIWDVLYYFIMAIIIGVLLHSALAYALNLRHTKWVSLVVGILFSGFYYIDETVINGSDLEPSFNHLVKPPFAIWVEPKTVEQFHNIMDESFVDVDETAR